MFSSDVYIIKIPYTKIIIFLSQLNCSMKQMCSLRVLFLVLTPEAIGFCDRFYSLHVLSFFKESKRRSSTIFMLKSVRSHGRRYDDNGEEVTIH